MNYWAQEVLRILKDCNVMMRLAKLYVYDVRMVLTKIERGLKFEPSEVLMIYDPQYEPDNKNKSEYEYSSMVLLDVMNSIHTDMQFTIETQCEFMNKYLPTLDFQMQLCHKGSTRVKYMFFKKSMSAKVGRIQTSALGENIKSNTICQEVIRRLSNTHRGMTQSVKNQIMETYFNELRNSAYNMEEIARHGVPGIVGFVRRERRELDGGMPVPREGNVIKKSTNEKRLFIKSNWYKKPPSDQYKYNPTSWGGNKYSETRTKTRNPS